jgi:hypothetical protein
MRGKTKRRALLAFGLVWPQCSLWSNLTTSGIQRLAEPQLNLQNADLISEYFLKKIIKKDK